jgi:hypothetical protein
MNIFRIVSEDEEELLKQSFNALGSIEPRVVPLKKSGAPTSPLDGVTFILIHHQIF